MAMEESIFLGETSDDHIETLKESPNDESQLSSKGTMSDDEMKSLTEKLSAALANVSAKEDLVNQHAKVAEEAVAGWEKAENEVSALKQQLEVVVQQNLKLEVKTSHLDIALKECVRQLRQARDDEEKRISDAILEKSNEWELIRAELEKRIDDLQAEKSAATDPNTILILEALESENLLLREELVSRCRELEVVIIERDLSTQAVETASKLQLESIKKVAKLEEECRRLQSIARKSSSLSLCAESQTESIGEANGSEPGCLDSQASVVISRTDQLKKKSTKNLAVEIDMMDDFLEMERLAALPESSNASSGESISVDNPLRDELDNMIQRVADLENLLEQMESEKIKLQNALDATLDSLKIAQSRTAEAESELRNVQEQLKAITETKESLELLLDDKEVESRTISAHVESLKAEIERERKSSEDLILKCQDLENELNRRIQETELEQSVKSNGELKIKQEDLAVAAEKLAECQKTIASLGRQLQSLATLEDFLIDTSNIPEFSREPTNSGNGEIWRVHHNVTCLPNGGDLGISRISMENLSYLANGNEDSSRSLSSPSSSTNHGVAAKSRNSFGKFFC